MRKGQNGSSTWSSVLQIEVFIFEFHAIDGFSTSSIVVSEISSLTHKVGDNSKNKIKRVKKNFSGMVIIILFDIHALFLLITCEMKIP